MQHEIPELDTPGLRRFGLTFAGIIAVLFGLVIPFLFSSSGYPWWPWAVAGVFVAWSLAAPATLKGFYRLWMRFGFFIGGIVNRVLLSLVFYVVVLPIGLIFRLTGKDPMTRRWDPDAETYRNLPDATDEIRMDKPF